MEDESVGESTVFTCLETLSFGFVVVLEGVEATGLVSMDFAVVGLIVPDQFIVDLDGFLVVAVVEVHVGQPLVVLDVHVGEALLVLEEGDGAHPVPDVDVVLQLGDLLFLLFHGNVQTNRGLFVLFSFGQGCAGAIH